MLSILSTYSLPCFKPASAKSAFYALGSFEQNPRASILGRKFSLISALFVSLWLIITKT